MASALAKPALDAGLVSANPEVLVDFYVSVFGLERLDPLVLPSIGTIHKLAAGESVLRVMQPENAPAPEDLDWSARAGVRYLTFEVVDVAGVAERVQANGGRVAVGPVEVRPGRTVYQVHDPDGNMIEIGEG